MKRQDLSITIEWLLDRVIVCPSGCWLWTGAVSTKTRGNGYAKIMRRAFGGVFYVHRLVYEFLVGTIPYGFQVDHVCARWDGHDPVLARRCCNPFHLEAVPDVENQRRKFINNRQASLLLCDEPPF